MRKKNKQENIIEHIIPMAFTGVNVVGGDLNSALRVFKRNMKESNKIKSIYENKFFQSKSEKRKVILNRAKYLQSISKKTVREI